MVDCKNRDPPPFNTLPPFPPPKFEICQDRGPLEGVAAYGGMGPAAWASPHPGARPHPLPHTGAGGLRACHPVWVRARAAYSGGLSSRPGPPSPRGGAPGGASWLAPGASAFQRSGSPPGGGGLGGRGGGGVLDGSSGGANTGPELAYAGPHAGAYADGTYTMMDYMIFDQAGPAGLER